MPRRSAAKPGQVMVETVIAVLIITFVFLGLFSLSRLLNEKILLEYAAMRTARARTVGLNDFMCQKSAKVAVIPVAGPRIWPQGEEYDDSMELARLGDYMRSCDCAHARGVLDYANWDDFKISIGDGSDSRVKFGNLEGRAGIERNATYYLNDWGL